MLYLGCGKIVLSWFYVFLGDFVYVFCVDFEDFGFVVGGFQFYYDVVGGGGLFVLGWQ